MHGRNEHRLKLTRREINPPLQHPVKVCRISFCVTFLRRSIAVYRRSREIRTQQRADLVDLHGKAVFENNMAAKEMCIANPIVKGQYGEATNPIFEVFYLEDAHGAIADFSGNPPYEF